MIEYAKKETVIEFRIQMPEKTGKSIEYRYQQKLELTAIAYLKKNYPFAKKWKIRDIGRFSNIHDVVPFMVFTVRVSNHKSEHKIVEVEI